MMEWRDSTLFPGYQISSTGLCRNPKSGRKIGGFLHVQGYRRFGLWRDGKQHGPMCHALVANEFLGPRPVGCEINHKNGIKDDNRAENLEYVPHTRNMAHAIQTGLQKTKLTPSQVWAVRDLLARGVRQKDIAAQFSVSPITICDINRRRTWAHLTKRLSEYA